ncbi:MAG: DUF6090 family protein [Bacteroidia bacterium]|nr:DUF6090 family protein [Bacteroidia bacterium]
MKNINWPDQILNFLGVILGVLLAFYISSVAEDKKEEKELDNILVSFRTELENDLGEYSKGQIPFHTQQAESMAKLLESLQTYNEDSVEEQISVVFEANNYSPQNTTYLSVVSSGKMGLIEDLELRKNLSRYYDVLSSESIERGKNQIDFFMNQIIPWMINHTDLMDVESKDIARDKAFANSILIYQSLIQNKIIQYQEIAHSAEALIQQIEAYQNP